MGHNWDGVVWSESDSHNKVQGPGDNRCPNSALGPVGTPSSTLNGSPSLLREHVYQPLSFLLSTSYSYNFWMLMCVYITRFLTRVHPELCSPAKSVDGIFIIYIPPPKGLLVLQKEPEHMAVDQEELELDEP